MARVEFGPMITGARGSVGSVTFSVTASGATARRRQKPTFPRTNLQGDRNASLNLFNQIWRDQLTPAQRTAWGTLAAATTFTDAFGNPYTVQPNALFVRSADAHARTGVAFTYTAPIVATEVTPDLTITSILPGIIHVDTWPNLNIIPNGRLQIFLSAATPVSQNHHPTSFQFLKNVGIATFSALPVQITTATDTPSGSRYFLRFLVARVGLFPPPLPRDGAGVVSFPLIRSTVTV